MRCHDVGSLLVAYLDGEVTPSQRTLIQAHLAGCGACQEKQAVLSALQSRISRSLHIMAAQAEPSLQAWNCLEARLARGMLPSPLRRVARIRGLVARVGRMKRVFEGGLTMKSLTMKKGLAFAILAPVVIALGAVVLGTPVRAQVGDTVKGWLSIESKGGTVRVSGSDLEFTPLSPAYLPAGFDGVKGTGMRVDPDPELELTYADGQQFVVITQSEATDAPLPDGREVAVNGQPAVLVDGLEGAVPIPGPEDTSTAYTDGIRLTWYGGDLKVEVLSNLPEAEVLRIAESLVPAETGEGGPLFDPLPSPDAGGGVVTQQDGDAPGTSKVLEETP